MNEAFEKELLSALGAKAIRERETIQSLWSGYGKIVRYDVEGGSVGSVVVKLVRFPNRSDHPRGWNSDLSHRRKVRSYEVEARWYEAFAPEAEPQSRLPKCYASAAMGDEAMIALEDLDAAGFSERRRQVSLQEMFSCLAWLAAFHARFLGVSPVGLWEKGTYWHLDTRPEELAALDDKALQQAAGAIDTALNDCRWQTIVHGDAKLANFCFGRRGVGVAAVDFQYVGGGCGMKDVAYFIGSCLEEADCERLEEALLDRYFSELEKELTHQGKGEVFESLEAEWRPLFPVAWTDFHRFLKGWSPGHWKLHGYSERLAREVIAGLGA